MKELTRLVTLLAECQTREDVNRALGEVDRSFQQEKINWKLHELLFEIGGGMKANDYE